MTTPAAGKPGRTHPPGDDIWRPRGVTAPGDVARYSRIVRLMRLGLPITAAVLVLLIVIVPQFRGGEDRFRVGDSAVSDAAIDALSMVNARYFGTDAQGQPFSVTAKSVRERTGADKRIELGSPQADITLNGGTWLSVEAEAGLYDRNSDMLELTGNVSLFQDQGYEMHTAAATVNLKVGAAQSRRPVEGQGPFGQLSAAGFDLYDKGNLVVFAGPARVQLSGIAGSKGGKGASP